MSINTNTWTEATDGLTNNERGLLWSLINPAINMNHLSSGSGGKGFHYPEVRRTNDPADDVARRWRDGVRVKDGKQIAKALAGLEAKGYIITAPRTGVTTSTTLTMRRYHHNAPLTFSYLADEYEKWKANPSSRYALEWHQVMHVRVPMAAALRDAIAREREQVTTATEDSEYMDAKQRLDNEPQRLAEFVALLDEYRANFGDGSLPVQERENHRGKTVAFASDLLGNIEREAKRLRSWIDYSRDGDIETVAARESQAVAA